MTEARLIGVYARYEVVLDPARPYWPGVIVAGPQDCIITVQAGIPGNFADSNHLGNLIRDALNMALAVKGEAELAPRSGTQKNPGISLRPEGPGE